MLMTPESPPTVPALTPVPSVESLGGAGPPDPGKCAATASAWLQQAAGDHLAMTSVSLEFGRVVFRDSDELVVAVNADKKTRAVAFVSLVATVRGELAFSARGLFSPR